jgi:transketolase
MKLQNADVQKAQLKLLKMHYESGVGHIGGNLSSLDSMLLIFSEFMTQKDKFILSKGHSSGALYVALQTSGLLPGINLNTFHKEGTILPGHPPANGINAIPFATGSLGHGLSLASGTALAKRLKAEDGHVFCLTSDGEWQEGSTWEALVFACHHKLTNLTILVDHNELQGFGSTTEVATMAPLGEKLLGFDVEVISCNGHDLPQIRDALNQSASRMKLIVLNTIKGNGVSFMENKMQWHYLPLSQVHYEQAVQEINSN